MAVLDADLGLRTPVDRGGQARPRAPVPPAPFRPMPYLPGLDGLRAIAVLGVLLYHLDLPWIPGGFLGVDVFFVLSGFLITSLVAQEVERTGRLDFRAFYRRRARRLLPALVLLLLTVSTMGLLFFREELLELRGDVLAALLYVSNWWYILGETSYFEFTGRPPVLQHLWSLAVEEQFYLLWPSVVVVALASWRGRSQLLRVAALGALASTVWMVVVSARSGFPVPNDPSRAYFGTDTHAMSLLAGAALAAVWVPWRSPSARGGWRGPVRMLDAVGLVALAAVLWTFLEVGEFSTGLYRGGFLLVAVLTAVLVASLSHPESLLARLLGTQPWRYLGERSYGIYLWHWPVFMVTRPGFELDSDGFFSVVLRIGLVLTLAEASYRYVELPIRRGGLRAWFAAMRQAPPPRRTMMARRTLLVAGSLTLLVGLVTLGLVRAGPSPAVVEGTGQASALSERPASSEPPAQPEPSPAVAPDPPRVSAVGDSVMLGAGAELEQLVKGVLVDAAESRSAAAALAAVSDAAREGRLGPRVVVHLGTNGPVAEPALREALLRVAEDHQVLLVNTFVPRPWKTFNNAVLARVAADIDGVTLLDWAAVAAEHPDWLYPDKIHLRPGEGRLGYATLVQDALRELRGG